MGRGGWVGGVVSVGGGMGLGWGRVRVRVW